MICRPGYITVVGFGVKTRVVETGTVYARKKKSSRYIHDYYLQHNFIASRSLETEKVTGTDLHGP